MTASAFVTCRVSSRASATASRAAVPAPALQPARMPSQTATWISSTSTPAPRRHEITCALRGYSRSYVPKYATFIAAAQRGRTRGRSPQVLEAAPPSRRLGENLVHVELRALSLLRSLFVVARDHLADQAEREELQPNDDEKHAERQKRAPADRVSERLVHGQ